MFLPVKPEAAATSRYLARQSLTADNAIVETITRTAAARRPTSRYSIAHRFKHSQINYKSITNLLSRAGNCDIVLEAGGVMPSLQTSLRLRNFFFLAILCSSMALAQRDLGTITGIISDPQGAAVPNAKVTITEDATGLTYDVQTNSAGEYIRPLLKPGTYTVTAEATGFRRIAQKNVVIVGGDRVRVPLVLAVGDISQSIEISAEAPLLQTEDATLGASLNARQISQLPLGGQRIFAFLARTSPGVLPAEPGARDAVGGGFSANGVRSNGQNNFLLNGVDNNVNVIDFLNQTAFVVGPSVEAIGEMTILTNGYNAEYGRGAGGVVNVNLKSGTNQLRGTLWE